MKVYIVIEHHPYEFDEVIAVFDSETKAQAEARRLNDALGKRNYSDRWYNYSGFEVQ
jgi:hypothetical protein